MSRLFALTTLLTTLMVPPAALRAADKPAKSEGPALMVRLQSISQLLDNAEYMVDLAGLKDDAGPVLGFIKALVGDKSLEGIDIKRPFVLYASLADKIEQSEGVFMVPIADQDSFLGLLKQRANLEVKENDGLYSTTAPNVPTPIYFRFAHKYVYITMLNKENILEKRLPKPDDVVGKGDAVLSVGFRIDRLPEQMKKFALGGIENGLATAKEKPWPNETPNIKALRVKMIDSMAGAVKAILDEGKEFTIKIDVQPKKDEFAFEFEMTALEGSDLAKDFAELKSKKGVAFGSLPYANAAVLAAANLSLPASLKKVLGPAIDDMVKAGLEQADGEMQEAIKPLIKAIVPTLKTGDFDNGFALLGPDSAAKYTLVTAGKVAAGKELEKAVRDLIKKIPEPVQGLFDFDADAAGGVKLHSLKVKDQLPDEVSKVFGEADGWFAFRDDATLFAFGLDAKKILKDALGSSPAAGSIIKVELSLTRLMPLVEALDPKAAEKIALEVFGKNPGRSDTMAFSVEGGESLRIRAAVKGKVIKFGIKMMQHQKAKKAAEKPEK